MAGIIANPEYWPPITQLEARLLALVAEGLSNKEIARALNMRTRTVQAHLYKIFPKLEARDRTHAVTIALKCNYLVYTNNRGD